MPPPTHRAPLPPALSLFLLLFNLFCHVLSHFSHVQLFAMPWTAACQAPLSIGFSRQEYWTGLPFSPTGDLPNPGIKPKSPVTLALQVDSLLLSHRGSPSIFLPYSHQPRRRYILCQFGDINEHQTQRNLNWNHSFSNTICVTFDNLLNLSESHFALLKRRANTLMFTFQGHSEKQMISTKVFSRLSLAQSMHTLMSTGVKPVLQDSNAIGPHPNLTCRRKPRLFKDGWRRYLQFSWSPLNSFSLGLILSSKDKQHLLLQAKLRWTPP